MKNKILLSIGLLVFFASVKAMENNNPQNVQQVLQEVMGPIEIIKQFLVQQGMLGQELANNPENGFGWSSSNMINNNGESNKVVTFSVYENANIHNVDITAVLPQIEDLLNQNNQE